MEGAVIIYRQNMYKWLRNKPSWLLRVYILISALISLPLLPLIAIFSSEGIVMIFSDWRDEFSAIFATFKDVE